VSFSSNKSSCYAVCLLGFWVDNSVSLFEIPVRNSKSSGHMHVQIQII